MERRKDSRVTGENPCKIICWYGKALPVSFYGTMEEAVKEAERLKKENGLEYKII